MPHNNIILKKQFDGTGACWPCLVNFWPEDKHKPTDGSVGYLVLADGRRLHVHPSDSLAVILTSVVEKTPQTKPMA